MPTYIYISHLQYTTFISYPEPYPEPVTFYGNCPHNLIPDPFCLLRLHHISSSVPTKVVKTHFFFWMKFLASMHLSSITNTADIYQTYSKHEFIQFFSNEIFQWAKSSITNPTFLESFNLLAAWKGLCPTLDAQKSCCANQHQEVSTGDVIIATMSRI